MTMTLKKTLREREAELRTLLPTPEGRVKLQLLAQAYAEEAGRVLHERGSLITYILVHERERGLVSG